MYVEPHPLIISQLLESVCLCPKVIRLGSSHWINNHESVDFVWHKVQVKH